MLLQHSFPFVEMKVFLLQNFWIVLIIMLQFPLMHTDFLGLAVSLDKTFIYVILYVFILIAWILLPALPLSFVCFISSELKFIEMFYCASV